jgi:DNA polymerase-3 subunit gamma/tau
VSYIVMARKYRPQTLEELVGQEHVARTLSNAIAAGRIAHAYLFTGPRGVGKTTTARILAKAVNCAAGPTPTPCGVCEACTAITEGRSMDVIEIDGASNRGIDEIRDLRERVRYAPPGGRRKVYIIDEVHMLTTEAFNALLKTLEEPPAHVLFIFATTAPQKIPLTISSRCQRFDFRRIPVATMVERLAGIAARESLTIDRGVLERVARKADGSMRDAESLLDQVVAFGGSDASEGDVLRLLGIVEQERLFSLGRHLFGRDLTSLLSDLDELTRAGWDLMTVVSGLIGHVRNLLVAKLDKKGEGLGDLTPEEVHLYRSSVQEVPEEDLLRCLGMLTELEPEMKRASQPRALAEVALLGFAARPSTPSLRGLIDRLESLESRLESGPGKDASGGAARAASAARETPRRTGPVKAEGAPGRPGTEGPAESPKPIAFDGELDLATCERLWEQVVGEVKARKRSLGTFLEEGKPDGIDRGVLRLLFATGKEYHAEQVMDSQNRRLVCETLTALLGRPVGISCRTEKPAAKEPEPAGARGDAQNLSSLPETRRLMEAFDGEIVRVVGPPRPKRGA